MAKVRFRSSSKNVYANKIQYTQEELNEKFTYKDGKLYHKNYRDRVSRGPNLEGVEARRSISPAGRCQISIDGNLYLRSRVIWKMINGIDPVEVIDHRNNDCTDDRIENLRDISQSENLTRGRWPNSKLVEHLK